ncbi:MAG: glycosyl hydrolase 115 family protein [Spirochaetales bacterium]|nr:glycosyl hydrolase 115 family protein [Spirochaetales bacterium]
MKLIIEKQNKAMFYREDGAWPGVSKIAGKVMEDIRRVTGFLPSESSKAKGLGKYAVIYGTLGKSPVLDELVQNKTIDPERIRGKRECYIFTLVEGPFPGVDCALVIAGSDKRGTIYGLFHLSELMGVSPLVDWSDVLPQKRKQVVLTEKDNCVSREPSVRYRGFFINDEWPAFGNWANKRFGGVNAKMYEHVFELLLRLKGNYLWPAMWASVFSDDGPGLASAELADELGVVMGMSHHEPCLRHGEEYKHLRGRNSKYGDAWNFRTNRDGITRFWEDGLKRSGRFENVITVGMRGEQDTAIMGREATLADNIELLRDVLQTQNRLISENVNRDLGNVPRMLALYKEVEAYFYGDEKNPGLIGSEELEDVILMFSDDNFGNLRTLPTDEMRDHKGGYGIYYHFDYHGWPVSFEWINCSYLPKVWEQLTAAWEFGVRELWIVNVGDICTQEFPLSYFLDLAYDFDRWGTSAVDTCGQYTQQWVDRQFSGHLNAGQRNTVCEIMSEYTRIAHMRRPEAMNAAIYHPLHFREAERMLTRVEAVIRKADKLMAEVPEEIAGAVYALVCYPALGNMNVQKMHLLSGRNMALAEQRRVEANLLPEKINECIARDRELVDRLHKINRGKWYGMGLSEHIGFRYWNEEECAYPLTVSFEPANKPRIIVSVPGTAQHTQGGPWERRTLYLNDFSRPDRETAFIDISCAGRQSVQYEISTPNSWLHLSSAGGTVKVADRITVTIHRKTLTTETQGEITVSAADTRVTILVPAVPSPKKSEPRVFIETAGYLAMEAEHFHTRGDTATAAFKRLPGHGKTLSAMKVFPVTASFLPGNDAPYLEYRFIASTAGEYVVTLYMSPSNAVDSAGKILFAIKANSEGIREYNAIPEGQKVGDEQAGWGQGVLANIRTHSSRIICSKGLNSLRVYAISPGFVLERIVMHPADRELPVSCLGPEESWFGM